MSGNKFHTAMSGLVSRARQVAPETALTSLFLVLFVVSSAFLSWKIDRDLDPDYGKEYWVIAFEERDALSGFFIENHSDEAKFTYAVSGGGKEIASGIVPVARGERRIVDLSVPDMAGRVTVTVEDGQGKKKSIYLER